MGAPNGMMVAAPAIDQTLRKNNVIGGVGQDSEPSLPELVLASSVAALLDKVVAWSPITSSFTQIGEADLAGQAALRGSASSAV